MSIEITITLPSYMDFKVRGHVVRLPLVEMNETNRKIAAEKLAKYGVRLFNDGAPMGTKAPGKEATEAEKTNFAMFCRDNAQCEVNDWVNGVFETERAGRESDPVQKRMNEIAKERATASLGTPGKDDEEAKKAWVAKKNELLANPKVREMAERQVAELAEFDI